MKKGIVALGCALVFGCSDDISPTSSAGPIAMPTMAPGPTPTPTPSPSPSPTASPSSAPYYTAFDQLQGKRTVWMGCSRYQVPIPGDASMGSFSSYQQFALAIDPATSTYAVSSSQPVPTVEQTGFSAADLSASPASIYVQPPANLVFQKVANGANYTLSTGSVITEDAPLLFAKNIVYSYNGRTFGEVDLFCTTGIATRVDDLTASATFAAAKARVTNGRIADRTRFDPDLVVKGGDIDLTFDKASGVVDLAFVLTESGSDGIPHRLDRVVGTGAIDRATGRFSGRLTGSDQDSNSVFAGSFYGPDAAEFGVVVKARGRADAGDLREYVFAAAGRR